MKKLLILAALLLPMAAQAKKTVIKMATMAPKGSAFYNILTEMAETWKTESDGQVQVRVFAGGVAGDDADVIRKIRLGTVNGGLLTVQGISTVDKAIHALVVPMAYDSYAELDYVFERLRPDLEKIYADQGFVVLNWVQAGWVRFFSKEAMRTPADLEARKLFVSTAHPVIADLWKAAGFTPIPLPSTEISTALQTGLIDVLPAPPQIVMLMQWNKALPFMASAQWAPMIGATLIDKKTWDEIDPAVQPKLLAAAQKAGDKMRDEARPADLQNIEAMKGRGLTVVDIDAATLDLWRKRTEAAYPEIRGKFAPADMFDRAMTLRDEFRKLGKFTTGDE